MTDAEIRAALKDPRCPWAVYLTRDTTKAIVVADLERFVKEQYVTGPGLERRLDEFVSDAGGRRLSMFDPWGMLWNIVRLRRPKSGVG